MQKLYCINECLIYSLVLSLLMIVSLSLSAVARSDTTRANGQSSIIEQVHESNISQYKRLSCIH